MNSTITVASASSSSSGAYCSSPRSPLDDIEVHSPLRPTRRIGVARSFSSPTSRLEKDRHSLNRLYHHQLHHRHLVANKNNACSLFDLLEAGWEDTKRIKNRANTDFISSNNKNKQLAISLTKFQFWSEIEDLTSDIDSSINSKDGAAPPPSPATVEEQEDEHEEHDSAAVDDLLDLAFDCDFQDSFNLESCRMKRRCHRISGRGRHYSSSDMTREQQDHHLLLDEISISEPISSEYDDDDDEISIAEEEEDAKMQTTVSSFAEHDSSYDIDISHADEDELSLDNTTLQTDKEYDEVHIDEDDDDDPHDDFAVTMTDVVMDVALDADFGSRDSVKIKMCHRAQLQNDRNRQKITSRSSTL